MPSKLSLLFLCILFLVALPGASAQSPDTQNWQIPNIECGEGCFKSSTVDGAGNLYIYVKRVLDTQENNRLQQVLYVIPRGTNQVIEHDLSQIYSQIFSFRLHFVPFSNNNVVVFNPGSTTPLTLFKLESESVIALNPSISGTIEACHIFSSFDGETSIYRIGQSGVLFCSRDNGISFLHLAYVENDQLVVEDSFEMGGSVTPERYTPPWLYLTSSLDGKIYIVPIRGAPIEDQLAPQYANSYDQSDYLVLGYDPVSKTWSTSLIRNNLERWIGHESTSGLAPFLGADRTGNLYFWHNYSRTMGYDKVDLIKYNAQGEKIWHLTEADFGGRYFKPYLVDENQFILDFGEGELEYVNLNRD